MKKLHFLLLLSMLMILSCKKTEVDGSGTRAFQESVNDMASTLNTIKQIKFNEALYILKTFAVEGNDDITKLKNLAKLLDGKKIPEIFSLADEVAQQNGVSWNSTGPPSLGAMNIFGNENAAQNDPNDVSASALSITTKVLAADSIIGVKSLQILPRLMDNAGKPLVFEGAGLETTMEVYSGGSKLMTSKNLMQNNNFKGFTLRFASLSSDKIVDGKLEVKVTVKTTKKTFKMIKSGIEVNPKALLMPAGDAQKNPANSVADTSQPDGQAAAEAAPAAGQANSNTAPAADPKATVSRFLNNLSTQNLRAAFETSDNPNWGSFEKFSNPNSGFGAVKSLNVKNISSENVNANTATVNATYDVTDNSGRNTALQVAFGLKNINGEWKVTSYKIK